jgi:hypothetical protein
MGIYGKAAVRAKQLVLESRQSPEKAWELSIAELTKSRSSQTKGCPKGAFLGLCSAGVIAGIPGGVMVSTNKNGQYALVAWEVLQSEPILGGDKKVLWSRVRDMVADTPENENCQMDVVVCLWRESSGGENLGRK